MRPISPAKWMEGLPIRRKISGIVMLTTICALFLACGAFIVYDFFAVRRSTARDLDTLAAVVASNSAAALMFKDVTACREILSGLRARPSINGGAIYTSDGKTLVTYGTSSVPGRAVRNSGVTIDNHGIHVFRQIEFRGEVIGMLYLASDLREMQSRMRLQVSVAGGILVLALLAALAMTARLQSLVTGPLLALADTARRVTREKDYSVRVAARDRVDHDEIGAVMHAFNDMLEQIEFRDEALGQSRADLERQVLRRTEELLLAKNEAEDVGEMNAQLHRESALILNTATDGIMGAGIDNRLTFLNPAGARILGMTLSDMRDSSIHEIIHRSSANHSPCSDGVCAMRRGESIALADDTFWRPDGTGIPVEYSSTAMFDENGIQLGTVMMFRDVTERRAVERLKSEFVSTVSHELRTPLTSIRGALGLLSSGLLGTIAAKGQRMLEIAVSNTDRLVRLINDILDLERIDSGKVELARSRVDANAIMVQAQEGVQSIADQAGVRLVLVPAAGSLWGDSDRIVQTLTNLLGNAIKFSPTDTAVTLSGVPHEADFVFCVSDQGRGVPEHKLDTIFERFNQVDSSDSRDKGGSGLGLAICKSIVNAHGGRIWAETNDPAGSRFQFTIPLANPSTVVSPLIESPPVDTCDVTVETPCILVVEDDLDLARVMTTALQNRGMQTLHAGTGADAIQHCRQHQPDLIVLDLVLPDMDGFAIVRSLRENATLRGIPLLVYSALDVGSADQSRLSLGRTEFLTKSRGSLADFEKQVVRMLESVANTTSEGQHAAA